MSAKFFHISLVSITIIRCTFTSCTSFKQLNKVDYFHRLASFAAKVHQFYYFTHVAAFPHSLQTSLQVLERAKKSQLAKLFSKTCEEKTLPRCGRTRRVWTRRCWPPPSTPPPSPAYQDSVQPAGDKKTPNTRNTKKTPHLQLCHHLSGFLRGSFFGGSPSNPLLGLDPFGESVYWRFT